MNDQCIDHGQKLGNPDGYGSVRKGKSTRHLHRVVYAESNGLDEQTMGGVVMHSCDNPRCINPAHLSLGTQQENLQDMVRKGRDNPPRGDSHPSAVLTAEQVLGIRKEYIPRHKEHGCRAIARRLGVAHRTISAAVRGIYWKEA